MQPDRRARLGEEGVAGGCEADAARVALEQAHADLLLELCDRLRKSRLGD